MKKGCVILFLWLTTFVSAMAVSSPKIFKHIYVKDGLLSGNVYSVAQGTDGCMWIATANGLSMYNGYDIVSYKMEALIVEDSDGNDREWLFADSAGNIWVSYDKLALYNSENDSVEQQDWFPDAVVTDYFEAGNVLFIATDKGLVAVDMQSRTPIALPQNLSSLSPLKFTQKGDALMVYTRDNHLVSYDLSSDSILLDAPCAVSSRVTDMLCDESGSMWLATNGAGLYRLDDEGKLSQYTISSGLVNSNYIRALSFDEDNMLWVGTGNGLSVVDITFPRASHVLYNRNNPNGISNNSIMGICRSRDGGMWLSNMGHGVDYYYKENNHFSNIAIENIPEVVIGGIAEDSDASIWIGTSRYGVFHYFPGTGFMQQVLLSDDPVKNDIKRIDFSVDGKDVYFCTARYGLNIYNRKSGEIKNYSSPSGIETISSLYVESERFLWLGTHVGVYLFDLDHESIIKASPSSISQVYCIFKDGRGVYWLGTENALVSCTMSITEAGEPLVEDIQIYGDITKVQDIKEHNGDILAATMHGLYCKGSSEEWTCYNMGNCALPSNNLCCLEIDGLGRVWIGTENGLSCFDMAAGGIMNFYGENGLSCYVFRKGANLKTTSGVMYMGGFDGLVSFNPENINGDRYQWTPFVSDISSMGERVTMDTEGRIVLAPNRRSVSLTFAVPNYTSFGRNSFAFRLLPMEKEWSVSSQRNVHFADLRAGKYTFELALKDAKNQLGGGRKYSLEIVVEPYWYETPAAIIIVIIIFFAAIINIIVFFVRRQKKKSTVEIEDIRKKSKAALDYRQARFYANGILSSEDSKFLNKVISIVEQNLQNSSFSVETLSNDMCTCRSNLYRKIMAITGDTVQNLIKKIRLEKAIQLMESNKYTVSQISEMVGFSSTSYFVSCFKEYTGKTPGNMKKNA